MAVQELAGPFLPKTTQELVRLNGDNPRFPLEKRQLGLHLDKFTSISKGNEKEKKKALGEVIRINGDNELLKILSIRRAAMLKEMGACSVEMKTAGPLALHLSRGGTWENAGICLHPVYGFAYIPGSGIKGLVRSWAETVWAQAQENKKKAWNRIDDLFGYSTNSESHKFTSSKRETPGWRPEGIDPEHPASAGRLVFHDAWPKKVWPCLEVDIANNHHTKYYDGGNRSGPGDWEDPVPIYFLCVRSNTLFGFAISDRNPCSDDTLEIASSWLVNALQTNGAGAKTAAGYGRFFATGSPRLSAPTVLRRQEYELKLVSPAFLAGSNQKQRDCDLRGATLRGLLRWWWRAMYAGKIGLKELRTLETAIWGSVEHASPLYISVRHKDGGSAIQYTNSKHFLEKHGISSRTEGRGRTTLGLYYTTYGMAEKGGESRWYRPENSHWQVVFTARDSWLRTEAKLGIKITADEVERQASAALWLLCRYGGVGAKSRKGFGSLEDISPSGINSLDDCNQLATDLASTCGIQTPKQEVYGPSLETALSMEDLPTEWYDPWWTCHMIGEALKAVTKLLDKRDRPALGMPRKDADRGRFREKRHASPVFWSLSRHSEGKLAIRLLAFPSPKLPNTDESKKILDNFVEYVKSEISKRSKKSAARSQKRPPERKYIKSEISSQSSQSKPAFDLGSRPACNQVVEAEILSETTKKGKLKAKHIESGWIGHIIDTTPGDVKPGQIVELFVHAIHEENKSVSFKWTAPKKIKPDKSRPGKPKHSRSSSRKRR